MVTALLVIDVIKEFFVTDPLLSKKPPLVEAINELVDEFHKRNMPVIWVRQKTKADHSDASLRDKKRQKWITVEGTQGIELLDELHYMQQDCTIFKNRYSAFFGSNLKSLLEQLGVDRLVVAGINTHACIRTSVIDAYQFDIKTIIPKDAVTSWDDEHHAITLRYFEKSMDLPVVDNKAVLTMLDQ